MSNVAILTNFQSFNPWYSLTGIARDQANMLSEYGNQVSLFVDERFQDEPFIPSAKFFPKIPAADLHDYQNNEPLSAEHEVVAAETADMLINSMTELAIDAAFTHDFIFTGWNKPYAYGIMQAAAKLPKITWLHWVHSVPSNPKDWWNLSLYPGMHRIIYPNKTDSLRVAECFRTPIEAIKVIPHIKDLRVMFDFDDDTKVLIDSFPGLMQSDVVQIYPASADRFPSKGVADVIKIIAGIKQLGHSVCLFIANQWATTAKHHADITEYNEIGRKYGLVPGKELIFSSGIKDTKYKLGVPARNLYQLMMLSNLFVFPTTHETFGLVLPEVSLASGALCVLNKSLQMQQEISGFNTMYLNFGAFDNLWEPENRDDILMQYAIIIMGRMQENDAVLTRSHMRKTYNYDNLYKKYYAPIMAEARLYL